MKILCRILGLWIFFLFLFSMLFGCTSTTQVNISTNNLVQTDYDYQCLDGTKTFTQIIVCYQAQDKAEKVQNKITNELLKNK